MKNNMLQKKYVNVLNISLVENKISFDFAEGSDLSEFGQWLAEIQGQALISMRHQTTDGRTYYGFLTLKEGEAPNWEDIKNTEIIDNAS